MSEHWTWSDSWHIKLTAGILLLPEENLNVTFIVEQSTVIVIRFAQQSHLPNSCETYMAKVGN